MVEEVVKIGDVTVYSNYVYGFAQELKLGILLGYTGKSSTQASMEKLGQLACFMLGVNPAIAKLEKLAFLRSASNLREKDDDVPMFIG